MTRPPPSIGTSTGAAIWAVPLTVTAYVAAGLPLRRILYNETWSLAFYLSFVIRFFLAGWSFWLLVCALPVFTLWAGDRGWMDVSWSYLHGFVSLE